VKRCLFCENSADSLEHVIPQWIHRAVSPQSDGAFPVNVGRYVQGKGYLDQREQISLAFKARIVCKNCNNGWMSELESEIQNLLCPFLSVPFPDFGSTECNQLRVSAPRIALWMAKTALTTSFALPGRQRLPASLADHISRHMAPPGVWIDIAKSNQIGIGAALSKTFFTINGDVFVGPQTHNGGGCFQFCLHVNQLLLRVGMSPGAEVGYVAFGGVNPLRIFPDADIRVLGKAEYNGLNHFVHSVVLRTWYGCPGEVPDASI
jgi:hypothetical protein